MRGGSKAVSTKQGAVMYGSVREDHTRQGAGVACRVRVWRRVVVRAVALAVFVVVALASPALAVFAGRNGLLAVQPRSGVGILLVAANGRGARRICARSDGCVVSRRPRWSPDGRALVFAVPGIRVVYADGSCMNCQFGAARNPAFEPSGTVVSFIQRGSVWLDGIDGLREPSLPRAAAGDAVWSGGGRLAVVRRGVVWAGRAGRLSRIGAGTEPSWSPRGTQIAAASGGWIVIFDVGGHRVRRLVRGIAPTFSPDGRWIAYVAPDHRLMLVGARGRHAKPRRVGNIRAVSVDWQPRPRGANPGCAAPPGSRILASSAAAVVTDDGPVPGPSPLSQPSGSGPSAYMGCLRADGRQRWLERLPDWNIDNVQIVGSSVVAAPYAALVMNTGNPHYGDGNSIVQVFDLRTGEQQSKLGGESAFCPGFDICGLDQLVLGSDGVSAAHFAYDGFPSLPLSHIACSPTGTPCVAVDLAGQVLSSADPSGGAGTWTTAIIGIPPILNGPNAVACPSPSLCVAVSGSTVYTSTDPTAGAAAWTRTVLPTVAGLGNVTCPSTTACVATGVGGNITVSTNPTGGVRAWSTADIDGSRNLGAVLCSQASRCFVTDDTGTVLSSSNPTGGASAWTVSRGTPAFVSGSCPTTTLCVALTSTPPRIFTTTDPVAGTWTPTPTSDSFASVACPAASLCIAVGGGGALDISTDPTAGVWTSTTIDNGRNLSSVACPSASFCAALDGTGRVITTTDPTGGPGAWTPALIDGPTCTDTTPCSVEQLQASDRKGLHAVDSGAVPGSGPLLTGLTLTGDLLSWSHAGTPRTIALTP